MTLEETIKELGDAGIKVQAFTEDDIDLGVQFMDHKEALGWFEIYDQEGATEWLKSTAIQLYPESEFSRKYG